MKEKTKAAAVKIQTLLMGTFLTMGQATAMPHRAKAILLLITANCALQFIQEDWQLSPVTEQNTPIDVVFRRPTYKQDSLLRAGRKFA